MARRPSNPFGIKPFKPKKLPNPYAPVKANKPDIPAAPRNYDFENLLCKAIHDGVMVELRYHKPDEMPDTHFRTFGPTSVYHTETHKICVAGEELGGGPHNFEVGRIVQLRATANPFQPSFSVDYTAAKYRNGVICRR